MRLPVPVIAVGVIALLVVGFVFVFMLLAAVRLAFAVIELLGGLLLVAIAVLVVWKLFLDRD